MEEENDVGYVDDEDKGIQGKMFVNQHMIKICFKDPNSSKEEKKSSPHDKPGKVQITPKKSTKPGSSLKQRKSPRGYDSPSNDSSDVISLKYTIDYPRVELHPLDTRKF